MRQSAYLRLFLILSGLGRGMGVDRSDVESSGDEEDHGFHRLEASVSTRFALVVSQTLRHHLSGRPEPYQFRFRSSTLDEA
jgi:hypothetical protein